MTPVESDASRGPGWILGQILQGIVLGALSIWALTELIGAIGGLKAFRYEGF